MVTKCSKMKLHRFACSCVYLFIFNFANKSNVGLEGSDSLRVFFFFYLFLKNKNPKAYMQYYACMSQYIL